MKKQLCFIGIVGLLFSGKIIAQSFSNYPGLRSFEILEKVLALSEEDAYGKAAALIEGLNTGDSLYDDLMTEKVYFLYQDSSYQEAYDLATELLKRPGENIARLHLLRVLTLRGMEKYDEAIAHADEALKLYPHHHLLHFQRGITNKAKEDFPAAYEDFKNTIYYNPLMREGHIQLGLLSAQMDRWVEGALALTMAVALGPEADNAIPILQFLESLLVGDVDVEFEKFDYRDMDNFEDIELILHNKVSLNKKYKLKSKVDYRVLRQLQVLMESLSTLDEDEAGFFGKYYVPFFKRIYEEDYTELFFYYLMANLDDPRIVTQRKSKKKKLIAFVEWASNELRTTNARRFPLEGEREEMEFLYHSGTRGLYGMGKNEGENPIGLWRYFHTNGEKSAEGHFDEEGKRTGDWYFSDDHGRLRDHSVYRAGELQDTCTLWAEGGFMERKIFYVDNDARFIFNYSSAGVVVNEMEYKDNERHGFFKRFHQNGMLQNQTVYANGEPNDTSLNYFDNGDFETFAVFSTGKQIGQYRDYFRDSVPHIFGNYEDGKETGTWEIYYDNGKLYRTGEMVKGKKSGVWKEYYRTGVLKTEINHLDGEQHGSSHFYDFSGNKRYSEEYEKGKITSFTQYKVDGSAEPTIRAKKGQMSVQLKNFQGHIIAEGKYKDGLKDGLWTLSNALGVLNSKQIFKAGELDGQLLIFSPDGKVSKEIQYKNGKMDGLFVSYYQNGQVNEVGYFNDGQKVDGWFEYLPNGDLNTKMFFRSGAIWGDLTTYAVNGQIREVLDYTYGEFGKLVRFDTTGAPIDTLKLEQGGANFKVKGASGIVDYEGTYEFGARHGKVIYRNGLGNVVSEGDYWLGQKHGRWVYYNMEGKLKREEIYSYGELDGPVITYYEDGAKDSETTYSKGVKVGVHIEYFENGKVASEVNFMEGQEHGEGKFYAPNGQLAMVRLFDEGEWVAYSYLDANGNLKPFIYLTKNKMTLEAFYQNGKPSYRYEMAQGVYDGKASFFYPNGQRYFEMEFTMGLIEGEANFYFEDGKMRSKVGYQNGLMEGIWEGYHPNGKLKTRKTYLMGELHGLYERFDKNGKQTGAFLFYDDNLEFKIK
jgi:uncharacterized protein